MPLLLILTIAAQFLCVIHAVKNGNTNWIWIIIVAPGLGCAAYALSHVAPDLFGSYGVRRTARRVLKSIDPERERRHLQKNLDRADTVENKRHLAQESLELKDYEQAKTLYVQCLSGIYERDPDLMLGLAQSCAGLGDFPKARQVLEDLIAFNPDFRSPEGHLLYAQALSAMGEKEKALNEFSIVKDTFPGEQGRIGYAELLIELGKNERAKTVLEELVRRVKLAPSHYQRAQAECLQRANNLLKTL